MNRPARFFLGAVLVSSLLGMEARPESPLVEVTADRVRVTLKYPGMGERMAAELDRRSMVLHTSDELAGMFTKSTWKP